MPYNNTAIPPSEEITGTASLPLARVKRILQVDEDINQCSNNAAFAITIATEMFIRYLSEQAYNVVKSERKPRRNIQYKDLANAVSRIDNLEFLSDVIPKTMTYKQYKAQKAKEPVNGSSKLVEKGQTTLDGTRLKTNGVMVSEGNQATKVNGNRTNGLDATDEEDLGDVDAMEIEGEIKPSIENDHGMDMS
ncbi:MAG: hypothetical protein M1834_007841 [Cirrosporium novae-zelandiae]|nr:MAG: hypothetical protein M1834_007841 [Cirrosporium novae-zelandiae]